MMLSLKTGGLALASVLVLALPIAAAAQTSDLLISEYVEGSSNNKALEIFNGTEDFVNLGGYAIERYSNGATVPAVIPLTAVDLAPGDVYVVTNNLADAALLALADQTSSELNFNGDDALVLTVGGNQVVDSFGQVGVDPGSYWSCPDGNTQNHTLRRLSSICNGDLLTNDPFDPCGEFTFLALDTFSGLGYHIADCGAVADETTSWGDLKATYR